MKPALFGTVTGLLLMALPASAAPTTFNSTGAIVDYTVPVTGQYTITAVGARGGNDTYAYFNSGGYITSQYTGMGGRGAEAGGTFTLTQGETLEILAGGAGKDTNNFVPGFGGGGGGSFVVGPGNTPLVVAGGGGGGGIFVTFSIASTPNPNVQSVYNGGDALTGPNGGPTIAAAFPDPAETDGLGGTAGGNGQGGLIYAVGVQSTANGGRGFNALPSSLGAGAAGGGGVGDVGGGGGGGYSGGGGGGSRTVGSAKYGIGGGPGGGGGSYTAGSNPVLLAGIGTGDGVVTINLDTVAVPEPGSLALLSVGVAGLCAAWLRRRAKPPS